MEDDAFTDALREAMTISRRPSSRVRSPDETGPSGSSNSITSDTSPPLRPASLPHIHSSGSGSGQAKVDRVILILSLGYVENFIPLNQLYLSYSTRFSTPSNTDPHASSLTDEDTDQHIAAYRPNASVNTTVRGLLRQLNRVDGKTTWK